MQIRIELQKNSALSQKLQQSNVSMPNMKKYNFLTRRKLGSVTIANNSNTILYSQHLVCLFVVCLFFFFIALPHNFMLPRVQDYPPAKLQSFPLRRQGIRTRQVMMHGLKAPPSLLGRLQRASHQHSIQAHLIKLNLHLFSQELARDQHEWASKVQRKRTF